MHTLFENMFNLANKLIRSGAEVNYVNSYGYTALHWCVMKKQKDASNFLLQKGANQHIISTHNPTDPTLPGKDCCDLAKENGLVDEVENFYNCNHMKKI